MTEPRGPRRPIPPGGADAAVTTGRRRLRRRRATAAGASLAVLAVVAVAVGGGGATSGLRPTGDDPLPTTLPTVSSTPGLPSALPSGLLPTGTAAPSPTGEPEHPEASEPDEPASSPTATHGRRWIGRTGFTITFRRGEPEPTTCPKAPAAPANGFCTYAIGPRTITPGDRAELTLKLCRATSATETRVQYPDLNAPAIRVSRPHDTGETDLWRWRNQGDRSPFVQPYSPGDCDTWTVVWRGQDDEGYALPPGDYQVNVAVPDANWGTPPPPPAFYTVRVTA